MGVRSTVVGDHDDFRPLDPISQCRVWISVALATLAELEGLPDSTYIRLRRAKADRIMTFNTARLRELTEHQNAA